MYCAGCWFAGTFLFQLKVVVVLVVHVQSVVFSADLEICILSAVQFHLSAATQISKDSLKTLH